MPNFEIDIKRFHKRAKFLISQWKSPTNTELFQNTDAILILVGEDDDENPYRKSTTTQTWLVGAPFFHTLMLLTPEKITFVCSQKKANIFDKLKNGSIPVDVIRRGKNVEENLPIYQPLVDSLDGNRVGVIVKDRYKGNVVDEWTKVLSNSGKSYEQVDIAPAISACIAVKDDEELRNMRTAAKVTSNIMKHYFTEEMSKIIDEEKKVSHEKLADMTEAALEDPKIEKRIRLPAEIDDKDDLDWCYTPIIQSGGNYDLRTSAVSDNKPLRSGVILCSLGVRYKYYCSNIGRTYLIDPTKTQEKNYEFLLDLQQRVMETIRDGVKIKDVYNRALAYIKNKRPDLESHFTKNAGFGMGIEFRESNYVLTGKSVRELKNNMVLNLSLGFADLENTQTNSGDTRAQKYSLLLIDTIRVTNELPITLTECSKRLNEVSYFMKEESEDGDQEMANNDDNYKQSKTQHSSSAISTSSPSQRSGLPLKKEGVSKTAILRSKFRSEEQDDESKEQKRKEHQKDLFAQKQAEGLKRFSEEQQNDKDDNKTVFRKFESYRSEAKLPREVRDLRIIVDKRNDTVILPIYGMAVPFHISTLKTASKSDEGEFVMLRFNFVTPGQAGNKKEDLPFDDANATFVRALTFRSANTARMAEIYRDITELKKEAVKKEAQRKEMADVVEQDNLILVKGRRPLRLPEVYVRPQLDGKRLPGELEIHTNGLRYQSIRSDNSFNVLFSNVKHLFFQPCDNELLVLIHIHFKNPVLIGKKKTKDIQFYREASDIQFDETGNKRRRHIYGDEDELESEREERRRRANLNQEFKGFAEKIAEASDDRIEVDIPFRELGFQGVPFRSNVLLQPTTDCLVHLSDPPFLVITLSEIEIAHLERVQFGLKNFDLVYVFKDFQRPPIQINTIPMSQLDNVKEWLNSVDVAFTEGPVNLNWSMIMKTVNDNPADFFKNGGWNFLSPDSDDEGSGEESEAESEFEISSEELEESSSDESDFESEVASDSEEEEEEMSESGEDWDEMEEKARKADERKLKRGGDNHSAAQRKKVRR
ncbi:FACT complex subunit-domain-containing protein [Halteromyces radiatus]|uniref:FACT complex subunit-domain-containing protein n=1 Tax=Halteromyces radiatus TaxID=101107 RepID=UPI00221F7AD1|nr:FACT complex subunit-domain-containing protein [Halteromyces radiatus]KAI8089405.1 FACT complex subunit-domain-containing protein [Halteromyces radiatus]